MLLIAIGLVAHIWGKKKEKGALNGLTAPLKQTTNEKGKEQHLLNKARASTSFPRSNFSHKVN